MALVSWKIGGEELSVTYKGACIAPHHEKKSLDAYQDKLTGFLAVLMDAMFICINPNVAIITLVKGCDGDSALRVLQDHQKYHPINKAN